MRRRTRSLLGVLAAAVLVTALASGRVLKLACDGSLEGYAALVEVRSGLAPSPAAPTATAPVSAAPPTDGAAPPPGAGADLARLARSVGYNVMSALIGLKQSDAVAYPAHTLLAGVLALAQCDEDAVRLQWIKAAIHARDQEEAERVALALRSGARRDELAALRDTVHGVALRESWSQGIARVDAALRKSDGP